VSQLSNHRPELLDNFQLEAGGFARKPAPQPLSADEAERLRSGEVYFWIEYFLRNRRGGRYLAGPFLSRANACQRAAEMLAVTDEAKEIKNVTVLALRAGGAS
jgi:hypothetical protein